MWNLRFEYLNRVYDIAIFLMSLVVTVLVGVKMVSIVVQIPEAIMTLSPASFDTLITEILTFFVLIELAKAFTEYLEFKRVRLHIMAELASIFTIRELLISLYKQNFDWTILIAFSILILSLTLVRTMALKYKPSKK
ncbi:phosphate-starvation-inducible PsiE family protein [Geoglobus acetivorans]|uniref:Phosphate-starvation-inducible PsiE family protein n=1 Tax=Geoglobus acetivorans TaxID=565033 RepID=A0ABZ3H1R1_GEOAI|nr:phosphate-starvation-inducible PsiE family protein [Geoglobus acetivorans]